MFETGNLKLENEKAKYLSISLKHRILNFKFLIKGD